MSPLRSKKVCLLLTVLCCLAVASLAIAGSQDDDRAPTAENLWKAEQAGDLQKAEAIRTILEQEAAKSWRSPSYDEVSIDNPRVTPPLKDGSSYRLFKWGNDATIAPGTVSGGISVDYDASGNLYAVRCTTWAGVANARVHVYKSVNEGASWSWLCGFYASGGSFTYSYPVIVTGTAGTPDKLYIFYVKSTGNGDIAVARFTQTGSFEGFFDVKADADTITYLSACGNIGAGSRLMVAYQREKTGDSTPDVYTITSTNYGETWSNNVWITSDGTHPDIAYGSGGYVFLTYESTFQADDEIQFGRSTNYCVSGSWGYFEALTADGYDDNYPKIGALHTSPAATPYVWVAYNHDYAGSGNIDLRFAYSSDGGLNWTKNRVLANAANYNEMASDLWVGRNTGFTYVNVCFLAYRGVSYLQRWYDIYWGYLNTANPDSCKGREIISDNWGAWDEDGRKVCQGTYGNIAQYWSGVVYAGHTLDFNYQGLYFDHRQWTDVEDEITEEDVTREFSLYDNYPNPFNPETKIRYSIENGKAAPVVLRVYNLLGQTVRTLVDEPKESGNYEVVWDGRNQNGDEVASGVYFYKLEAGDFIQTKKMVLVR